MTPNVFKIRLGDVFEILNHTTGDGKGRVFVEPRDTVISRMKAKGIKPPERFLGKRK